MKLNNITTLLIILVVLTLFIIGIYEIFFVSSESDSPTPITQISTYYGEDVLNFIQGNEPTNTSENAPATGQN
jgi:flagellar basal body-associated protein FliL